MAWIESSSKTRQASFAAAENVTPKGTERRKLIRAGEWSRKGRWQTGSLRTIGMPFNIRPLALLGLVWPSRLSAHLLRLACVSKRSCQIAGKRSRLGSRRTHVITMLTQPRSTLQAGARDATLTHQTVGLQRAFPIPGAVSISSTASHPASYIVS